jgi:group I intron endonuclease
MPVIYKIENLSNGNIYVGSALSEKQRRRRHFKDLRNGNHHCKPLQRAYDKYGKDSFVFIIIEQIDKPDLLIHREQFWIDTLKPKYNTCKKAGSALGVKQSKETILKNKIRNTGFGNGNAKIKENDLETIKSLINTNTTVEIAEIFNVNRSTIERLLKRNNLSKTKVYSVKGRARISELAKSRRNRARKVARCDKHGNILAIYPSMRQAAILERVDVSTVFNSCHNITFDFKKRRYYFKFL